MSVEEEKSEILRRSIPFGRIGEIASTADSVVWATDISSLYGGRSVAADKAQRIRAAAAQLIDLHDHVLVKPNWRSPENVHRALAKLEQIREAAAQKDEKDGEQSNPPVDGSALTSARDALSGTDSWSGG